MISNPTRFIAKGVPGRRISVMRPQKAEGRPLTRFYLHERQFNSTGSVPDTHRRCAATAVENNQVSYHHTQGASCD
jgi:hypothetical protein